MLLVGFIRTLMESRTMAYRPLLEDSNEQWLISHYIRRVFSINSPQTHHPTYPSRPYASTAGHGNRHPLSC